MVIKKISSTAAVLCLLAAYSCNEKPQPKTKQIPVTSQKAEYNATVPQRQRSPERVVKRKENSPVQRREVIPKPKPVVRFTSDPSHETTFCNRIKNYCRADVHPSPGLEQITLKTKYNEGECYDFPEGDDDETSQYCDSGTQVILNVNSQNGSTLLRKVVEEYGNNTITVEKATPYIVKKAGLDEIKVHIEIDIDPYDHTKYCWYDREWNCREKPAVRVTGSSYTGSGSHSPLHKGSSTSRTETKTDNTCIRGATLVAECMVKKDEVARGLVAGLGGSRFGNLLGGAGSGHLVDKLMNLARPLTEGAAGSVCARLPRTGTLRRIVGYAAKSDSCYDLGRRAVSLVRP